MTTCPKCGYDKAVQGLNEVWCDHCDATAHAQEPVVFGHSCTVLHERAYDTGVRRKHIEGHAKPLAECEEQQKKRAAFWAAIDGNSFILSKEFFCLKNKLREKYAVTVDGSMTTKYVYCKYGRVEIKVATDTSCLPSDALYDIFDTLNTLYDSPPEMVYLTDVVDDCIKILENK